MIHKNTGRPHPSLIDEKKGLEETHLADACCVIGFDSS